MDFERRKGKIWRRKENYEGGQRALNFKPQIEFVNCFSRKILFNPGCIPPALDQLLFKDVSRWGDCYYINDPFKKKKIEFGKAICRNDSTTIDFSPTKQNQIKPNYI